MRLSLAKLKDFLLTKGGYTIVAKNTQLQDLTTLVTDMITERNKPPPGQGEGDYSGTTCIGHTNINPYRLSLITLNFS